MGQLKKTLSLGNRRRLIFMERKKYAEDFNDVKECVEEIKKEDSVCAYYDSGLVQNKIYTDLQGDQKQKSSTMAEQEL